MQHHLIIPQLLDVRFLHFSTIVANIVMSTFFGGVFDGHYDCFPGTDTKKRNH